MLLEAQKGPESLQEALKVQAGNHRSQQEELRAIIHSLRLTLREGGAAEAPAPLQALLQDLPPQVGQLSHGLSGVQAEVAAVRKVLESRPDSFQRSGPAGAESRDLLGGQLRTNAALNIAVAYTAAAAAVGALYLLLRGGG